MALPRIEIETAGMRRLGAKAGARAKALQDGPEIRAVMQDVGKDMVEQFKVNIESFTPGRVRDLKPKYKKWKANNLGHVYPILIATGAFVASFYSRVFKPGTVSRTAWVIRRGFAGRHPSGALNNDIAQAHIDSGRDFTRVTKRQEAAWMNKILRVIRSIATRRR